MYVVGGGDGGDKRKERASNAKKTRNLDKIKRKTKLKEHPIY